ncbi:MAG: glycosyltransferase family 4 protein, partial [Acidobacteriaceae bacterium]|nr:glycosyltransferase family 4 protein [Acidobacteriaceae bacterium]
MLLDYQTNKRSSAPHGTKVQANILCIDQFSNFGGGQRSLLDLLPEFQEWGWAAKIALPGDGPFAAALRGSGFDTQSFACKSYASGKKPLAQILKYALDLPRLTRTLSDLVDRNNVALLYVNGPRVVPPAAWIAWRNGIPLVFHCHNRLVQSSASTITGQALELASAHVIGCCKYVTEPLKEYVDPQRLHVVYNGTGALGTRSPSLENIRTIGVVGRVEAEKGQLNFVKAARLVSNQRPECRFVIIGSPMFSDRRYYDRVIAVSCGLPVDFVEWRSEIAEVYSKLDLLVVPSSAAEATTRVIPEAFGAGIPVVAFPSGGITEIVEDEWTGFLAR